MPNFFADALGFAVVKDAKLELQIQFGENAPDPT